MLLRAAVQRALDVAAVGIGTQNEPSPRRAQFFDLEAQPVERVLRRLDVRSLQAIDLLSRQQSFPLSNGAASRGPARCVGGCQPYVHSPAATVVAEPWTP